MRKYFVIAFVIISLMVFLLIAAKFDIIEIEAFDTLKSTLRKGYAPPLKSDNGWVNTDEPVKLSRLKGKIVLINFWTYCNINSIHALKEIKKLEEKYPKELVPIGVHTGKFLAESELSNIEQAVLRHNIKYPVINDATFAMWHKYHIKVWPTIILINPEGYALGFYPGEGNYAEIDKKIEETIIEFRKKGSINDTILTFKKETDNFVEQQLKFPGNVLADKASDRLFIADTNHNRIVITDLSGKLIDIVGNGESNNHNGNFKQVSFNSPQGMALNDKLFYVADTGNNLIREVNLENNEVRTIAGTGEQAGLMGKGGPALETALNSPWDLTLVNNELYITMAGLHQIWIMDLKTNNIKPYAGNCREARVDGPLLTSSLAQPSGITNDGQNIFFADSETSSIRYANLKGVGNVKSIIGLELFLFGDVDGLKDIAKIQHPLAVHYHNAQLFIADTYNNKIKSLDLNNYYCKTIFGTGKAGNQTGKDSQFFEPGGLSYANGKLYIADTNNHCIKVGNLETGEVVALKIDGL